MRATSACPDSSQAPDIRLVTAALGTGLSFVFACPAVAAAGFAALAATLAGLSRGLRGTGGLSAGFVVLLAAGALALLRPEAWICVAAATAIGALLASDHVRAAGAASLRF
ncbi:MAG: hypothetical protein AABM33_00605 [Pseudomonadota bacterium]